MFLEHFQESFPKLIAMRNKEELEGLEKRNREVKKLIAKRKKKLEIDDSPDEPQKQRQVSSRGEKKSQSPQSREAAKETPRDKLNIIQEVKQAVKEEVEEVKSSTNNLKQAIKSKGGDPHGALQKLEQKEIDSLRKETQKEKEPKQVL